MSHLDDVLSQLSGRCTHGYHPAQRHSCTQTPSPAHVAAVADRLVTGRPWASTNRPEASAGEGSEWSLFVSVLRQSVRADGTVHQTDTRHLIRRRIPAKHVGLLWKRARREGLVVEAGHERSDDEHGKNAGRMEPFYELVGHQRGRPA